MFLKTFIRNIANQDDPNSISSRLRAKRIELFVALLAKAYEKYGCVNVLDMGGTRQYWNIVSDTTLSQYHVSITLVNLPGSKQQLSEGRFKYIEGDCCDLSSFADNSFHIVHSNSVVEHVGDWEMMVRFAREVSRLAPVYYVQTPNFWFPIEPHCMAPFFHWLPRQIRVFLLLKLNVGNWHRHDSVDSSIRRIDGTQLLDKRMFYELFKDAIYNTERFLLMPKSLIAIRKSDEGV